MENTDVNYILECHSPFVYCPEQKHNYVHGKLFCKHLQRPEQDFLQPHLIRIWHPSDASGNVVQNGLKCPSDFSQPQFRGSNSGGHFCKQ